MRPHGCSLANAASIVTRATLARAGGVSRSAVTKACYVGHRLHAAVTVCGGVDVNHPATQAWLADQLGTTKRAVTAARELEISAVPPKPAPPPAAIRTCATCGKERPSTKGRYCGDACRKQADARRAGHYYAANKERIQAYAAANRDKIREYQTHWRSANPDKVAKYRANFAPVKCVICGRDFKPRTRLNVRCGEACTKEAMRRKGRVLDPVYRGANREKINARNRARRQERYDSDPQYRAHVLEVSNRHCRERREYYREHSRKAYLANRADRIEKTRVYKAAKRELAGMAQEAHRRSLCRDLGARERGCRVSAA